jgi:hypothetical protein
VVLAAYGLRLTNKAPELSGANFGILNERAMNGLFSKASNQAVYNGLQRRKDVKLPPTWRPTWNSGVPDRKCLGLVSQLWIGPGPCRSHWGAEEQKKKKKNHAHVDQKGRDNAAALSQKGRDNNGVIVQRGHHHAATVAQDGEHNAFGLFQFGHDTKLDVVQAGDRQVGLVLQGGW